MYFVIAPNGKQYGPFDSAQVQDWLAKGWITPDCKIKDENETEWKTIADISFDAPQPTPQPIAEPEKNIEEPPSTEAISPAFSIPFSKITIESWKIFAAITILLALASIFWNWNGTLSVLSIIIGHLAFSLRKINPHKQGRAFIFSSLGIAYITLGVVLYTLFFITLPSIKDGPENLRRIQVLQDGIDQYQASHIDVQCWNASGVKISFIDSVILNPSETERVLNNILTLPPVQSANIPLKELTPQNIIFMRIGHDPKNYMWRVVCYRRNAKGYGVDRKGRPLAPKVFSEFRRIP